MKSFKFTLLTLSLTAVLQAYATDPTATSYTMEECAGSLMPYPVPKQHIELPDSLTPIFINHVGRHGARFPSSPAASVNMLKALSQADSLGTITPTGRDLKNLVQFIIETSHNRWGALDSLGMAEQRGIASRMFLNFPTLFNDGIVNAISSYAPRCVMSMYEFTHQLDRLNNHIEIKTSAGRINSTLLRPFDINSEYLDWRKENTWKPIYDTQANAMISDKPLKRVLGDNFKLPNNWKELATDEYHIIAGMGAMGYNIDITRYFTQQEYNNLWSCFNLKQYLQRTATTLSTIPADITSQLIIDLIQTCDDAVKGQRTATACLRFGHAETLMPLLSQLHLQGCYYMTNYYDTVAMHWKDFHVVPMASNLQMLISMSQSGRYYMTVYLNEQPVELIPGDTRTVIPYSEARAYMNHCLPLHMQL